MSTTFGPIALSSMWAQRFPDPDDLRPFFQAGRAIGFERFELSHTHSAAALATIPPDVVIASVHHPCPNDGPLALRPGEDATAPDPAARARWRDALRRTIGTAKRLGAAAVCAHLGTAHDEAVRKLWFELHSRYQAGQTDRPRYAEALGELRARLDQVEPAAIARAVEVLSDVVGDLRSAGVALGIETGYHAWELPTARGMTALLDGVEATVPGAVVGPDALIGAWLDTGHVGAQVNVGTASFEGWFEAVAAVAAPPGAGRGRAERGGRWVGVHWHDVVGVRDHLAVGDGVIPLARLVQRLTDTAAVGDPSAGPMSTMEIDWYFTPQELRRAAQILSRR
ncbi:MAG: hypothetical protein ABI780_08360 [Ardenticatenales bacterium]